MQTISAGDFSWVLLSSDAAVIGMVFSHSPIHPLTRSSPHSPIHPLTYSPALPIHLLYGRQHFRIFRLVLDHEFHEEPENRTRPAVSNPVSIIFDNGKDM